MMNGRHTQASVLFELGKPLRQITLSIPKLKSGQVLVDMAYSGICHAQYLEMTGKRGVDRFLPHALGHEGAGVVTEVGPEVKKVKPGDHVVLSWIKGNGAEVPQTIYESEAGLINAGAICTFMQRTVVSENRVIPISKQLPLREAAVLGCAIPTGAGIIFNKARVQTDSTVAIFGVGGIGSSAVLGASFAQAKMIIAVDIVEYKLEHARGLGATHCINPSKQDALKSILELTNGRGVDYALECAGRRETMETAFKAIRVNGGMCILAGNLPFGDEISINPFDLIRGKKIEGTWGGETQPDRDIPKYAEMYLSGKFKVDALITHEYSLDQINEAFDNLKAGKLIRAVVKF